MDELHVTVAPVLLGLGERPFQGVEDALEAFDREDVVSSPAVAHLRFRRRRS